MLVAPHDVPQCRTSAGNRPVRCLTLQAVGTVSEMSNIEDAYRKFSTDRFPLPTEQQLAELEARVRVGLPPDYRRFVLQVNGGYFNEPEITPVGEGCPPDSLTCVHGIGASHWEVELASEFYLALFDENDPPIILPIGHTSMGGLIILTTEADGRGEILLKQAFGDFHYLAKGIDEFFTLLREPIRK
jgi:hypothetical protein